VNFPFVAVNSFTPNNGGWSSIGNIDRWTADPAGQRFDFNFGTRSLVLEVLGPSAFRLRFNPAPGATYDQETSVAVVTRDLGLAALNVAHNQPQPNQLSIDTGSIRILVSLAPFDVQVYRGRQLVHRDFPGRGALYIPGAEVVAVMKSVPTGARYVGLGEKAGSQLQKNGFTFTYFNYDNYTYNGPSLGDPGCLNPTEPLYCSIPLLIELNPFPVAGGDFAGAGYACGIFLDNPGQSFVNVAANDYSDMSGRYYLGALYNELDYYFFVGDTASAILGQYTQLTGRAPMPPRYVFGYHQGAYGYYDHARLMQAANAYRAAAIPCDGLHIDVDFQNNYRTFTHSELKFPNARALFDTLHAMGFKMSTNITPIMTTNELAEDGSKQPYTQRDALQNANALIFDTRFQAGESTDLYQGGVNYGNNRGNNPYPYPPLQFNRYGLMPLTAPGKYPDFGLQAVRDLWGQQYQHLLIDLGLDMIWQDMTCPAIDPNLPPDIEAFKTLPQNLMMAQEQVGSTGTVTVRYLPNAQLHNVYVLNLLRATWAGINNLTPGRRNFIIARGGYAGMQRFAGLWTGDSASSWDFLQINIAEVLNLGLSGVPISGCDIGGFANGTATTSDSAVVAGNIVGGVTNYELLTRWMQLGSFLPWYRNHYDGYNKQFQEPYAYGEPVPSNCRKYVELRYRMLQVYYDAMYRWTQTGLPIARALFLNDSQDAGVYDHLDDQFFVGDDFLVAPMLTPHATSNPPTAALRGVYLPAGSDWYAFMDNQAPLSDAVPGGTYIASYFADLDRVPIYVRAGALLPFRELEQWVGQMAANPLTLNFYPGPDRWNDSQAYQLYQDDGRSLDAAAGRYRLSRIYQRTTVAGTVTTRQLRVARAHDAYQPPAGFYFGALLGSVALATTQVTRDGAAVPRLSDPGALQASASDAWYWNQSVNIVFVKLFDTRSDSTVTVVY
jgi:alpha-glucosidase